MSSLLKQIRELNGGRIAKDLELAMQEVLYGVMSTRGKGDITLKLKVEFEEDAHNHRSIAMQGEVKHTVPRPTRTKQTHYVIEHGSGMRLTRQDPSQPKLKGMDGDDDESSDTVKHAAKILDNQRKASGEKTA